MGGGAFLQAAAPGEPTLNISRLSATVYARLKDVYLEKLEKYFATHEVHCPIAAPEKADHGDVDIIASREGTVDFLHLANAVGASAIIQHSLSKCTLGVPKDGSSSSKPAVAYTHCYAHGKDQPSSTTTEEGFAQVDIELVPPHLFEWSAFHASYGDMGSMIGYMVHHLGFTIANTGLRLRMKELEDSKDSDLHNFADRDGRIELSHQPDEIMRFLGLSVDRYQAGFKTLDELYAWLGECRMLSLDVIKLKRDNSHERAREQKRPIFSRFLNEWLPKHMGSARDHPSNTTTEPDHEGVEPPDLDVQREQYLREALDVFHKRPDYERVHSALVRTIANDTAANLLKPIIARHSQKQSKHLTEILRAFRRWVDVGEDGKPFTLATQQSDTESELHRLLASDGRSLRDEAAVGEWVREHWEEVRGLERHRVKTQSCVCRSEVIP